MSIQKIKNMIMLIIQEKNNRSCNRVEWNGVNMICINCGKKYDQIIIQPARGSCKLTLAKILSYSALCEKCTKEIITEFYTEKEKNEI